MKFRLFLAFITILFSSDPLGAQTALPTISPVATYTDSDGNDMSETNVSESAPLTVTFKSGADNTSGWAAHYEWHFYKEGLRDQPYLTRYEEETSFTFTEAGTHYVELWAIFTQGTDTVAYTDSYWTSEGSPITIAISESKLEFPNAFSPNGDGINDVYKAKEGYQSIVEFEATIFNRWGQKLYSWSDPAGGWDGKYKGKDVKQGVYFVLVKAKGADGRKFDIKKDVNLLRGYTETNSLP
jgi:gliding motility-associated-like protein